MNDQIDNAINILIANGLQEDVGPGDFTSEACITNDTVSRARLLVKQPGILSGIEIGVKVMQQVDPHLEVNQFLKSGMFISPGDIALEVSGAAHSILKAERLMLNIIQRMSGIATQTHEYCKLVEGTNCRILDTRKTTPGFRILEKLAVKQGGGQNHRFGLYDMILIKDNHVDYAGGISKALQRVKIFLENRNLSLPVEIETRNMLEVEQVLQSDFKIQRIMLDNFRPQELTQAIGIIDGYCETEASGGINKQTIRSYAETGVDFISVGALTHSYSSLDLSLKAVS